MKESDRTGKLDFKVGNGLCKLIFGNARYTYRNIQISRQVVSLNLVGEPSQKTMSFALTVV